MPETPDCRCPLEFDPLWVRSEVLGMGTQGVVVAAAFFLFRVGKGIDPTWLSLQKLAGLLF